ncbi:WSC domain-containing protein 7 [Elsinoe fawcettii]|nr:WSC domain-containing protein 7 [Elsinoe fawcettii]
MEGPPQKKLKAASDDSLGLLQPGWTEHTAPSGHKYYYNKATKKSTYNRPVLERSPVAAAPPAAGILQPTASLVSPNSYPNDIPAGQYGAPFQNPVYPSNAYSSGAHANVPHPTGSQAHWNPTEDIKQHSSQSRPLRPQPHDRPKRKETIPDCAPWILVYTRLGRRFVHNTETQDSFWKFPAVVMQAVIKFDQMKLEEKYGSKTGRATEDSAATNEHSMNKQAEEELDPEELEAHKARETARLAKEQEEDAALVQDIGSSSERIWVPPAQTSAAAGYDSSEYEEVEVTDDSDAASEASDAPDPGPLEFNEDDIAFQLASLGEQYGLDPEEYASDEGDWPEGAQGLPMSDEERFSVFSEMLSEYNISPYTPWDALVSDEKPHAILNDDRFTIIPSSKGRKEAHARWCKETIALQQREKAEKKAQGEDDPRAAFLQFVSEKEKEVKKLYWVEFRRKHKREAPLRVTSRFGDKDMEKLYREYVAGLKKDIRSREEELRNAVKGDGDVAALKGEAKYWLVPLERREEVVEGALLSQGKGKGKANGDTETRAEKAMRERAARAAEEQRQAEKARRFAKGQLRDSEREIESAMQAGRRVQVAD